MKHKTSRYERLCETLHDMSTAELVFAHNEYCEAAGYMEDWIYSMDEFDDIMSGQSPWEIARCAYYSGKFCPAHNWFWFNGYGNLESDDFAPDIICIPDIARYVDRTENTLDCDELYCIVHDEEDDDNGAA